jgi:small GTP-binding protein
MIGDDYFQLRGQLASVIGDLRSQAESHAVSLDSLLLLDNIQASLKEPFVFVVVGEVNVGKSTFLNALFGQDFSRTGIIPTTEKILFFKHGDTVSTIPVTPTLDEVHIPCDFLRDFHIVDTPGTNSIQDEHQQITERFVPVADLVIFVFSASNPWGASAWQFLEKVHRQWMRNVIFVLQQCDLRTPEEIQVITDYMRQLTQQRFGRDFPLFPVSAKRAYLARSSGADPERLLAESGFPALERHISAAVTNTSARQTKLLTALNLARKGLDELKETVHTSYTAARRRAAVLQELITERALQMERTLHKIEPAVDATVRDYHDSAIRVAGLAAETLSTRSAFRGLPEDEDEEIDIRQAPPSLDHRLFQDLQHHNSDRWRQVALILDEDVHQFERYLISSGSSSFPSGANPLVPESDDFHLELRRHFTARIDSAIRRFVVSLNLDQSIEPGLKKAASRARVIPRLIAPIIVGAGIAFYFGAWVSAAAVVTAGLLGLLAFYLLTKTALNTTRRELIDKLDSSSSNLHELLTRHVTEDVEAAFNQFLDLLVPAGKSTSEREKTLAQHARALADLEERFDQLHHALSPSSSPPQRAHA